MRALLTVLSFGTGVALLAAPARADIPPDPNSVHAHCTLVEQCSAGVLCDFAWSPGGKLEAAESAKVGEDCRKDAAAKGLEQRCSAGGNYRGQTLHCPKGATGTWSKDGVKAVVGPKLVEPVFVPVEPIPPIQEPPKPVEPVKSEPSEPVKSEPVKAVEPVKSEPVKSGCAVDPSRGSAWMLVVFAVLGLRRRRG